MHTTEELAERVKELEAALEEAELTINQWMARACHLMEVSNGDRHIRL